MGRADRAVRASTGALAGVLLLGALLSACGASPQTSNAAAAVVVSKADCLAPEVLDELGLELDAGLAARASHAPAPERGRVPDDFVPAAVVECEVGGRMRDSAGTWTAVTVTWRDGSATGLSRLVDAFDEPAVTPVPCQGAPRRMVIWLVDAAGRAVLPDVALDGCGAPSEAVLDALDRLEVTDREDHPVEMRTPAP